MNDTTPTQAVKAYIEDRRIDDLSGETIERYQSVLHGFAQWLESEDHETIDVEAVDVNRYKVERSKENATATVQVELNIIHRFFRYCESNGLVTELVSPRILIPTSNASRDDEIDADIAESVLGYLEQYRYASRDHTIVALAWHTCMRRGALRSIDLNDVDGDRNRIQLVNREDTGTRLKNGSKSERFVSINDTVATVIDDYVRVNRIDSVDGYDRRPLFTTEQGRISVAALTTTFHRVTRPCVHGSDCPDERDTDDCDAAQRANDARHCPYSLSAHPCRRGAITHHLRNEVPKQIVSDRADVTTDVLDEHYNQLTEREKAEKRRSYLENI